MQLQQYQNHEGYYWHVLPQIEWQEDILYCPCSYHMSTHNFMPAPCSSLSLRLNCSSLRNSLKTSLDKMVEAGIRELPVVSNDNSKRVVSMLSRKDIIRTYHDEVERIKG